MIPARKRKLITILFAVGVLFIATTLMLYALRQNISLFYTPTQIAADKAPHQQSIRVGGMVKKGSIIHAPQGLEVQFEITDFNQTITVIYKGILPDLFREEQGVVAEGQLVGNSRFRADQVLAKHDANYMPPQVKSTLSTPKVRS